MKIITRLPNNSLAMASMAFLSIKIASPKARMIGPISLAINIDVMSASGAEIARWFRIAADGDGYGDE